MYIMIESIDKSTRYILKYKPFTYLIATFMAFYMAEIYPKSNTPLPKIFGIMFQNQLTRLIMLISIIYVSQYNYYLASMMAIILVSSYMLSDDFVNVPLEGFTSKNSNSDTKENFDDDSGLNSIEIDDKDNNTNENANNNTNETVNENNDDVKEEYDDTDYEETEFIDLDDKIDDNKNKIKQKYQKFALLKNNNREAKTINECINLISTLPSDGDDTYKIFLQNVSAQRKAYLDMIKHKTNTDDIEAAKKQYRKMLQYLTEEFLDSIADYDDEEYDDEEYNNA
jgi:hypothetical protein